MLIAKKPIPIFDWQGIITYYYLTNEGVIQSTANSFLNILYKSKV